MNIKDGVLSYTNSKGQVFYLGCQVTRFYFFTKKSEVAQQQPYDKDFVLDNYQVMEGPKNKLPLLKLKRVGE